MLIACVSKNTKYFTLLLIDDMHKRNDFQLMSHPKRKCITSAPPPQRTKKMLATALAIELQFMIIGGALQGAKPPRPFCMHYISFR